MALPRFYVGGTDIVLPRTGFPFLFAVPDTAAAHMRVLRMDADAPVILFDGLGGEFTAQVLSVTKKAVQVSVLSHLALEHESPVHVTIVQALAVGDKMDWIVQKACELGAVEILPIQTERCTLRLNGERAEKRVAHWQQVAVAASEQCGRNRVAKVSAICDFANWLGTVDSAAGVYFVLHPHAGAVALVSALKALANASAGTRSIYLLIGPEGGFSPLEMQAARAAGVTAVALGSRVLRTETAAAAALAVIGAVIGDLQ